MDSFLGSSELEGNMVGSGAFRTLGPLVGDDSDLRIWTLAALEENVVTGWFLELFRPLLGFII